MELGVGQVCGDWRNHRLDLLDRNRSSRDHRLDLGDSDRCSGDNRLDLGDSDRNLVYSRYNDRKSLGNRYCGLNMLDRNGLNSMRSSSWSTEMKIS